MAKNKYYIYCWWSGIQIKQEECKIHKIDDKKIYFWNDYCQEYQNANINNLRVDNNYYICQRIQY
tara:strand:- start:473 stop:667 length:195 start_codon:yes stop_codon:yes gene_type:complete